eukprot:scaffold1064_cov85-Amphora_coffeaeformis.AAC.19
MSLSRHPLLLTNLRECHVESSHNREGFQVTTCRDVTNLLLSLLGRMWCGRYRAHNSFHLSLCLLPADTDDFFYTH